MSTTQAQQHQASPAERHRRPPLRLLQMLQRENVTTDHPARRPSASASGKTSQPRAHPRKLLLMKPGRDSMRSSCIAFHPPRRSQPLLSAVHLKLDVSRSRGLHPPITPLRLHTIHLPFLPCSQLPTSRHACRRLRRKSRGRLHLRNPSQHQFMNLPLGKWKSMKITMTAVTRRTPQRSRRVDGALRSLQMVWLRLHLLAEPLKNRTDEDMFDVECGKMKEHSNSHSSAPRQGD